MRAVILPHTGGPEALVLAEVPDPHPSSGEVVIDVHATALNFADLLERKGTYGTPASLPGILGIECSGTIHAIGQDVQCWNVGDEVCALVSGGAYAERVVVPATQLLKRPHNVDIIAAAALPEAACTVWSNIIDISGLAAGEVVLVHGGAGGIGTFAIQAGRAMGARVWQGAASRVQRANRPRFRACSMLRPCPVPWRSWAPVSSLPRWPSSIEASSSRPVGRAREW